MYDPLPKERLDYYLQLCEKREDFVLSREESDRLNIMILQELEQMTDLQRVSYLGLLIRTREYRENHD